MNIKHITTIVAATMSFAVCSASTSEYNTDSLSKFNRQPLLQKNYAELPIGSIKPLGWLKEQLVIMKNGMTGHLDEIYPQVMGKRNGWLGGDGDVWERGPYWIDGLLPLAYILNDKKLIAKVKPWIEWTIASQTSDGYFGPSEDREYERGLQRKNSHDWWPKMVMLKVMKQYYMATGDKRVITFLTNYFRYQLNELPKHPLGFWTFWGEQRGGDNLMVVLWLYNITGENFLLDLANLIHKQTYSWTLVFISGDHLCRQHSLHCVNLAQGYKEPVVYYQVNKDPMQLTAMRQARRDVRHVIGLPTGLWGGDELLKFGKPTAGSELCTAVEMMFSLETILEITGDARWGDYLERVTFNALPTQINDDFSARQYYQQTNQISVTRAWREFSTPHDDTDLLFGVLNGYPCCTSNLHQGWPKFTQNLWYATRSGGLAALIYAPSEVKTTVAGNTEVTIKEDTYYPFDETINFSIGLNSRKRGKVKFPLHLRIPEWCNNASLTINGEAVQFKVSPDYTIQIDRQWADGDKVTLQLPADVRVERWYDNSAVVMRGSLLYALRVNEKWEKKSFSEQEKETYGSTYYEVTTDSPWNYALSSKTFAADKIKDAFVVEKSTDMPDYPWNAASAPVKITTKAKRVNDWTIVRGSVGPVAYFTQQGNDLGEEEQITLIPYGCTTLRIAEFPVRSW